MSTADDHFDVLGIGFGPANLSLAIALEEAGSGLRARFLEAQADPVWQGGMMLSGSNTQNHPCRDLVSLRNPRSRYSFLNFLFENDRLIEHLNLPGEFPLRKEYAQYIRWVTDQFSSVVDLSCPAEQVVLTEHGGLPCYQVMTPGGRVVRADSLVLAPGRTPYVPPPFKGISSPRVFHLTEYLYRLRELGARPGRVAVIGGSQSAVELTLDLAKRFPDAEVVTYVRSFGLRLKDTSPFSEEGFFPGFTSYYYKADRAKKRILDAFMRPTNYSSVDDDVLHELYLLIYETKLEGSARVTVAGNRQVSAVELTADRVRLEIEEVHTGETERDEVDLVVLATGFRDLGPGPTQEPYPSLLSEVIDHFRFDADGYLMVNEDYSLEPTAPGTPPVFLNGLCESSHGIGDSGSFSLLSLRAATIGDALHKRLLSRPIVN
jgi:L-ornithine N5-oxygenase